jgi:hypothetical protein
VLLEIVSPIQSTVHHLKQVGLEPIKWFTLVDCVTLRLGEANEESRSWILLWMNIGEKAKTLKTDAKSKVQFFSLYLEEQIRQ